MRQGVDYPGVAIVYYCHDGRGNVLMLRRNHNTRDEHDCWDIGGGGLEFGDTVEGTLRREIREEYCIDVVEYEFLGFRDLHRVHAGARTHWITLDFKVLVDAEGAKIGEPEKFDDIGLFAASHLPDKLHSQVPLFLAKYRERLLSADQPR